MSVENNGRDIPSRRANRSQPVSVFQQLANLFFTETIDLSVSAFAADDEDSFADGRGGGDWFSGVELPDLFSVGQTEFVEVTVVGTYEDPVANDNR